MAIKRTALHAAFSDCVRERSNWTCETCNKVFPNGQMVGKERALDCSHFYGRRNLSTRHHSDNCIAQCRGCHQHYTENPAKFAAWMRSHLGDTRYDGLRERFNRTQKRTKAEKKEMTAHFRSEFKKMRQRRMNGEQGQIEFVEWD